MRRHCAQRPWGLPQDGQAAAPVLQVRTDAQCGMLLPIRDEQNLEENERIKKELNPRKIGQEALFDGKSLALSIASGALILHSLSAVQMSLRRPTSPQWTLMRRETLVGRLFGAAVLMTTISLAPSSTWLHSAPTIRLQATACAPCPWTTLPRGQQKPVLQPELPRTRQGQRGRRGAAAAGTCASAAAVGRTATALLAPARGTLRAAAHPRLHAALASWINTMTACMSTTTRVSAVRLTLRLWLHALLMGHTGVARLVPLLAAGQGPSIAVMQRPAASGRCVCLCCPADEEEPADPQRQEKRRRFKEARKQHYNMREQLARCEAAAGCLSVFASRGLAHVRHGVATTQLIRLPAASPRHSGLGSS